MKNTTGLLPSGTYHFTCRQSHEYNESVRIVWTIDQDGEWKWRNLVEIYNPEDYYLWDMCKRLNYEPYPKDHPSFYDQFIGLRTRANVGIHLSGNYKTNVILEHTLPQQSAHIDVLNEKTDDHFFENKNKRKLPI